MESFILVLDYLFIVWSVCYGKMLTFHQEKNRKRDIYSQVSETYIV